MRIVFAGTPDFAVPPLEALIGGGFPPLAVLTQPDRHAGRGRKLQASPVKRAAMRARIPVEQPETLRQAGIADYLSSLSPDLMIVVAYGLILPPRVLGIPRHGCWNIHASLLPRWRGAAPIQRAIEAGDSETGICIMQMDEGLDTGPVLMRHSEPILPHDTGGSLHDRLAAAGAATLLHCVRLMAKGHPPQPVPQPDSGISYAEKLGKSEARIDWNLDAPSLERKVRAFNPWPVAWCDLAGERTRVWSACVVDGVTDHAPGAVVAASAQGIDIATGKGLLRLLQLQRPGARPISAGEYLNARPLGVGRQTGA